MGTAGSTSRIPQPWGRAETQASGPEQPWDRPGPAPGHPGTHLLASLMSAMAMRILFRRKMSSRMITASRMLRMITVGGRAGRVCQLPVPTPSQASPGARWGGLGLTEGHPCLPQVQIHAEVCLEAKVHQGDVGARLAPQPHVLHVAVKYACRGGQPQPSGRPPNAAKQVGAPRVAEARTELITAAVACSCLRGFVEVDLFIICVTERESRGRERGRERIPNRLPTEHRARFGA